MSSVVVEEILLEAPAPHSPAVPLIGALALTAELSACGGGGGGTSAAAPPPAAPPPPPAPPTTSEAGRFLTQATLGFTRADITSVTGGSYSAWITAQFALPRSQGHFDWLMANGYGDAANINNDTGLNNTIWRKFISSPDALRQRMVLALSEICVVSVLGIDANWRQFSVAN